MDPLRIIVRVGAAYLVMLVLLRLSGKRTVKHSSPFDLAIALILGDIVDDAIWTEVTMSQFLVAAVTLTLAHTAIDRMRCRAGVFQFTREAPSVRR